MKKKKLLAAFLFAVLAPVLAVHSDIPASNGTENGDEIRVSIDPARDGKPPDGWKVKEWKGKADFEVTDTEAGKTIHLRSRSTSTALYKNMKFEIRDFPVIHWKWKVTELPKGADVRKRETDDQAAQVYVVFPKFPAPVNSRVVGYIWDSTVPAGITVPSAKTTYTKYIVIKGGADGLGQWFEEKRNVYQDYRKLFNEDPPKVGSVSVMIDSDDTKSSAESFIGDIYFSK